MAKVVTSQNRKQLCAPRLTRAILPIARHWSEVRGPGSGVWGWAQDGGGSQKNHQKGENITWKDTTSPHTMSAGAFALLNILDIMSKLTRLVVLQTYETWKIKTGRFLLRGKRGE